MAGNIQRMRKKDPTPEKKKKNLKQHLYGEDLANITIEFAWNSFMTDRRARRCTEATLEGYRRFYKKLCNSATAENSATVIPQMPVIMIGEPAFRVAFINSLSREKKDISQQTINYYLRTYRAFGNYCCNEGYLEVFECPIKEVEPPIKDVYTPEELNRLIKEPDINNFVDYRNYTIIMLILSTGARSNTILNIRIKDVDLDRGYVSFNTTKAHKTIEEGLDPSCLLALKKYILRWRRFDNTKPEDYLFCSMYETKLARNSLCHSIAKYNKDRGVEKTSIHLFRHTFAKMWIQDGGDIITLARVLTHSELEMVKRYSNLYGSDVKEAIVQHSALSQLKPQSSKTLKTKGKKRA